MRPYDLRCGTFSDIVNTCDMCNVQVSIIPRTNKMLGFSQYMPEERKLHSQDAVSVCFTYSSFNLYFI